MKHKEIEGKQRVIESDETMFVTTKGGETKAVKMDRKQAQDLKKDPNITSIDTAKGQDLKEQGVKFSQSETTAIAKETGKALAKALKSVGDEIAHMKAKDIEENSFEIYVEYKNESDDQFSFYIVDDTLHLQDFSFDKELVDVGVKPSGEAIVHVDVLSNELIKHFRSLQESMSDEEWADAQEKERLDKHPEKSTIEKIQALLAAEKEIDEMKHPSHKSASNQYAGRTSRKKMSAAEKEALRQDNRDFIQRLKDKGMLEASEGMYYIKIPKDAASQNKAQVILTDFYGIDYEINDDKDGVVLYFAKSKFDQGVLDDLEGDQVEILDTNIPTVEVEATEKEEEKFHKKLDTLVHNTFGKRKEELKEGSLDAIRELHNLLEELYSISEQVKSIMKDEFPVDFRKGEAYGAFDFGTSANAYDTTFESILDSLEEDEMNEASANKLKKEYDTLVGKMKQLAQHFKTAEGEKKAKIVAALKQHTARKRELEAAIEKAVAGIGKDQELAELFGTKISYDDIIGPIVKKFHDLKKYVSKKEPEAMDDLEKVLRAFEIFDEKMSYGTHMELEEGAKEEGEMAATKGKKYSENPYEKGTKEHLDWSKGHNSSRAAKLDKK